MYKGKLGLIKYQFLSVIVYVCLIVRLTDRTRTKVGYSDPMILCGNDHRSTNKKYARDVRQEVVHTNKNDEISSSLPIEMLLPSGAAISG